ncbi:MAG: AI-2E family transporter [Magnetococcales bacterium]|nr:AI-2E family transporter [Magnetococcales bacterium]
MNNSPIQPECSPPFEEGFLLTLLALACGGLLWLFFPLLPGLFLAILLASSTYSLYEDIQRRLTIGSDRAALIMTVLIFFLVISPLIYLLMATGFRIGEGVRQIQLWAAGFPDLMALKGALAANLDRIPMPEALHVFILDWATSHKEQIGQKAAEVLLFLFRGITNNSLAFFSSLILVVFALFFFYRDGPRLLVRLKHLSPLPNHYDTLFFNRFQALATILTLSTLGIAVLQGASFSLVALFMGLPWFYLGVAIAAASFIPVVGGLIVWGPLAYILYWNGQPGKALFLVVWGAVIIGFVVDNICRPMLIRWLARNFSADKSGDNLQILDHTLLVTLATVGGLISFGIPGLLFGPMIAAMAITIFDLYELRHGHLLDRS